MRDTQYTQYTYTPDHSILVINMELCKECSNQRIKVTLQWLSKNPNTLLSEPTVG